MNNELCGGFSLRGYFFVIGIERVRRLTCMPEILLYLPGPLEVSSECGKRGYRFHVQRIELNTFKLCIFI